MRTCDLSEATRPSGCSQGLSDFTSFIQQMFSGDLLCPRQGGDGDTFPGEGEQIGGEVGIKLITSGQIETQRPGRF